MSHLKVLAVLALVAAAFALPDSGGHAAPSYGPPPPPPTYAPPPPPTYAPPPPPTYAPPPPPTYAPPPPPTYAPPPPPTYAPPPPPTYAPPSYGHPEPEIEKPEYTFDWAVKDDYAGLDFGQNEHRDGYNTDGSYHVLLPDGRVEKVTYTVTKDGGYVATVEFEGEVKKEHKAYGEPKHSYTPPPPPTYTPPPPPTYAPPPPPTYTPPPPPAYGHY